MSRELWPSDLIPGAIVSPDALLADAEPDAAHLQRYQIVRKLATGGMGEVFMAREKGPEGQERPVALKVLLPHLGDDPSFLQMFLDEARTVARLNHPNILHVHDVGRWNGRLFMAMPLIEGVSLSTFIAACGREKLSVPIPVVLEVATRLCDALQYAHTLHTDGVPDGVIHRDVTPTNVLVSRSGEVLLTDFGVAKAASNVHRTKPGAVLGKLAYMPPEQIENSSTVDGRSDLYSLAVTLFELLTKVSPFSRQGEASTLIAVLKGTRPDLKALRPDVPDELARAIHLALSVNVVERQSTVAQFRRQLLIGPCSGPEALGRLIDRVCPPEEARGDFVHEPPQRTATHVKALEQELSLPTPPWDFQTRRLEVHPTSVDAIPEHLRSKPRRKALAMTAAALLLAGGVGLATTRAQAPPPQTPSAPGADRTTLSAPQAPARSEDPRPEPGSATPTNPAPVTRPEERKARAAPRSKPRMPQPGSLSLDATPWAHVFIDGKRVDETPIVRHALPAGAHTVVFENPELGKRVRRRIQVQEGKHQMIKVRFP